MQIFWAPKGQLISKANCQAEDSSKKRTNEWIFTSMRRVYVRFLEESSARKKRFEIIWPLTTTKSFIGWVKYCQQCDFELLANFAWQEQYTTHSWKCQNLATYLMAVHSDIGHSSPHQFLVNNLTINLFNFCDFWEKITISCWIIE